MYYRVTGDSTQNRGVQPDITLPSAISAEEVGESSRDGSLPWNRIRPSTFKPRRRARAGAARTAARARRARRRRPGLPATRQAEIAAIETMRKREVRLAEPRASARPSARRRTQEQLARENAAAQRARRGRRSKTVDEIKDPPDAILARGRADHRRPVAARAPLHGPGTAGELTVRWSGHAGEALDLVLYLTTTL